MGYPLDLRNAAIRHFVSAEKLKEENRPDRQYISVAGYLYGWAAECALKEIMRKSGMVPPLKGKEHPFWAHFPVLKTMLRDSCQGRRAGELKRYAMDDRLMQNWDTAMRYSSSKDIPEQDIERWREGANQLVKAMEAP